MNSLTKIIALGATVGGVVASSVSNMFAYTTSSSGFPVVESTDTSTMLSGVGSAGTGILNFMTANWTVFVALAVVGAIVALIMHFAWKLGGVVRGR